MKSFVLFLLSTLLIQSGCRVDQSKGPDSPKNDPRTDDPISYIWNLVGTAHGKVNDCVGPMFVKVNSSVRQTFYLKIESENTSTMRFFSDGSCSNMRNEYSVVTGASESEAFYVKNTTNKLSEFGIVGVYTEGADSPLILYTINFQSSFSIPLDPN